ncbi:MAG: hypothetical protein AAGC81_18865 [Pseudomonadota bacterium]
MIDDEEWGNLRRPLGEPGSGLVRYAAAMHLRQRGLMDDMTLERYRICSRLDWEDPDSVQLDPLPGSKVQR